MRSASPAQSLPAGSCGLQLRERLLDGTYAKPFIVEQGALRFLQFDLERVQSLMYRDDPDALCLRYTRKMMAFLLFNPQPLGGGSLAASKRG
jgi:spermidine synthase